MSNVDACKALIDSQAAKGLRKYGVSLERSDATVSRLARHGAEEMADALAYFVELERRAAELEAENIRMRLGLSGIADWSANHADAVDRARKALGLASQIDAPKTCKVCSGKGRKLTGFTCEHCNGTGKAPSPLQADEDAPRS